jgi:signal transduction histidine kinase
MGVSSPNKTPPNRQNGFLRKNAQLLYAKLIEPRAKDEDARRREYILNVILAGSIAMLVLLDASIVYHAIGMGSHYKDVSPIAFSLIPLFFIFLHVLSRRGFFVPASYLMIGAYFVSVSYAVCRYGVYLPTALLGYAMIIVISGILISTGFGFLLTALTTLFITPLWYLQVHGVLRFQAQNIDGSDGIVFGALYAVIMLVTWLSNREIERSLIRARRSEAELKQERDSLEITVEERTEELREAQFKRVEQLYRFAELGRLASGLFHDMLNILNAISLRTEDQLNRDSGDESRKTAIASAGATTKQIEDFTKAIRHQLDQGNPDEWFSLTENIWQVIQLVAYKANKEHVRILFDRREKTDMRYFGNPFKFHQIMINLLLNAIQSYEGIAKEKTPNRTVSIIIEQDAEIASIHIEDHGSGIPEEIKGKIFEPFFTTKNNTQGMGIGLASVKKILEEDLKGAITVKSKVGTGSTFSVTFLLKHP